MYTPLNIKTNYSLLSSLIRIDDLLKYAKEHNFSSLAIADDNMFATMEFYKKCKSNNIKPIIGLEVKLENGILLIYAKDYVGYQSLIKLSTIQSEGLVTLEDIINYNKNVITIIPVIYDDIYNLLNNKISDIYVSYSNKDEEELARKISNKIVYVSEVRYLYKQDSNYLKYLYMIRDSKTITSTVDYDIYDKEIKLDDIYDYSSNSGLFQTNEIASLCDLEFPKSELLLPIYKETNGLSVHEYLTNLAQAGLVRRLNNQVPQKYIDRLVYELDIVDRMGFSNYFLVVYDFIKYAKKNKILVGPGRGSGAGSLICYSIGITDIDPIKYDLLFERFLNPERISMPDIDTDFPDVYREQVIDYVVNKYGLKRVSGIVTFGTLAAKQAIRDVSRVLNVPLFQVDLITKKIPSFTKKKLNDFYKENIDFRNLINSDEKLKKMFQIAVMVEGFPRHTSSHAAGIIMCKKDLDEVIPLIKDNNMYLSAYTMEYLEELGLLKMDFLGLKTLTTIMNIINDINAGNADSGSIVDFNNIPLNDDRVLECFRRADTLGIFQFESDGMRKFLRDLHPDSFEDIFAAIALFRPGPASNIDSYIRRKEGKEKITYLDASLEPILKSTKGIIIYQEQIIQIANIYAGYTLGEADILRRAMSKKKMDVLVQEESKFIQKSVEKGHSKDVAKQIFDLILNFANYGFNRSHSVAYSLIAYKMAYLKVYYPLYFYASLLTSVIDGEIKTKNYIMEAKAHGVKILPPSINDSGLEYIVEKDGLRFPLSAIKSIGVQTARSIICNRNYRYTDIFDFVSKTITSGINSKTIEVLIDVGCFEELRYNHQTLHHNLDSIMNYAELVKNLDPDYVLKPDIEVVDDYSKDYLVKREKELLGFYLSNHPVTFYKSNYQDIISLDKAKNYLGKNITTVVLVERFRVIQTKNGDDMMFFDGSDEYGKMDFTLFPKLYQQYSFLKSGDIIKVVGNVERRYDNYQVIINKLEKLN